MRRETSIGTALACATADHTLFAGRLGRYSPMGAQGHADRHARERLALAPQPRSPGRNHARPSHFALTPDPRNLGGYGTIWQHTNRRSPGTGRRRSRPLSGRRYLENTLGGHARRLRGGALWSPIRMTKPDSWTKHIAVMPSPRPRWRSTRRRRSTRSMSTPVRSRKSWSPARTVQPVRARQRLQPLAADRRNGGVPGRRGQHLGRGHVLPVAGPRRQLRRRPRQCHGLCDVSGHRAGVAARPGLQFLRPLRRHHVLLRLVHHSARSLHRLRRVR